MQAAVSLFLQLGLPLAAFHAQLPAPRWTLAVQKADVAYRANHKLGSSYRERANCELASAPSCSPSSFLQGVQPGGGRNCEESRALLSPPYVKRHMHTLLLLLYCRATVGAIPGPAVRARARSGRANVSIRGQAASSSRPKTRYAFSLAPSCQSPALIAQVHVPSIDHVDSAQRNVLNLGSAPGVPGLALLWWTRARGHRVYCRKTSPIIYTVDRSNEDGFQAGECPNPIRIMRSKGLTGL